MIQESWNSDGCDFRPKATGKSIHKLTKERPWPHPKSHNKRLTGLLLKVALKWSNCWWPHPGRRVPLTCMHGHTQSSLMTNPSCLLFPVTFLPFFSLWRTEPSRWWPRCLSILLPLTIPNQTETQKLVPPTNLSLSHVSLPTTFQLAFSLQCLHVHCH